ncbi:MAG: gliding motility-associated C-terminal domain-containing protein [Cyclobacteriaceae bacterium]|nr:gliding motility-associated C-terminal domain-containing protein [Cyclobacteriaceae bacterium]
MKRLMYLLTLCISLSATAIYAQEICANGIDDDLDGFIDCFDNECANNIVCDGGYVGNDLLCEAKPSQFPKFTLALESASPDGSAVHLGRTVVGDIDRDGIPEMITTNQYSRKIFILNGNNTAGVNTIQKEISVNYSPSFTDVLIGNIDNDNCAEIFVIGTNNRIYAYDCNLTELWSTQLPNAPGMMGLADFNGDGKVELYARNAIYNANTGAVIVAPTGNWSTFNGGPVAVDILNDATKNAHLLTDAIRDDNLELVVGGIIYSVNIGAGTINPEKTIPNFAQKFTTDATSIADYNLDGSLDVIASGLNTNDNNTTIFFWDVKNNVIKTYSDPLPGNFTIYACPTSTGTYYANGWHRGTGRVNIADLDGDGKLNVAYVSGKFLYALKEDMTLLWKVTVNEETSGNTGCTLFDFNGDGQSEIVYRDEKFVYIINGTNGTIFTQQTCVSRTNVEYPVVADVDADGNTELCVTCRTIDFIQNGGITDPTDPNYYKADESNFCSISNAEFSQVRVFRSGSEPWVPARRVWNQHGYFNVNVNDDLSIPRVQQKHHLVFSSNVCTVGANRPLNSFLNQSPYLNSLGCPKYASPDLAYVDNSLTVNPPTCPDGNFTVSFQITNLGDVSLSGDVPITFYNGDPTLVGAIKLNTITVTLNSFGVGNVQSITNATVNGPGSSFILYIVLNDGGTTVPTPIKLPNTNFIECDYNNNIISSPVVPLPVSLTALKVQDNIQCNPSTTPDNGAVRAFVQDGAVENTTDFDFYWSIGAVAKPIASADFVGPVYSGRPAGTYTVYAVHKTASCNSDTVQVVVDQIVQAVDVTILLENPYDNCKNPNAKLRAVVNDTDGDGVGDPVGNFTYTWYEGNDIFTSPQIGVSHVVTGLGPLTYTVLIKNKATGCQTIESFSIPDQTVKPVPVITKIDALCSASTTGSASALVGGATAGFTFDWYNGNAPKPTADFTGADYLNLVSGNYTLVVTNNASKCTSDPVTITITQTTPPVVTATVTSDQTSCDPTLPTGAASATVGGLTAGYTFEWFKGQNTLPANSVATTNSVTGLKAAVYTVKVTDDVSGCAATGEVTISFAVVAPVLSLASSSNSTRCTPPDGSITVAVSPDTPADYTFFWYDGSSVKATPDYPDTDETLSGLPAGTYTVKAINNLRHCETAPLTITIINVAPAIVFNPTSVIRPSTCNDNNGSLTVSVSAAGNVAGFDFEWRFGQAPFTSPPITTASNTATTSTATALVTGIYTLIATNRDNGCVATQTFDLPFDDAQVLSFLSKVDIATCVPGTDGSIDVRLTPTLGYLESDYRIDVFEGTNDLGPAGTVFRSFNAVNGVVDYTLASPLQPGFYTFVAITINPVRSTFNCRSVPVTVELLLNVQNPVFTANPPVNNVNCTGAPGTGQLSVSLVSPTINPADYNFDWFEGPDASFPPLGTATSGIEGGANGETVLNLPAGKYTVVVTKAAGASAGCAATATYEIFDNTPVVSLAKADVTITDVVRCDMLTSGTATVNFVLENGAQFPAANYDFEWFSDDPAGPQLIVGVTTNTLLNQPAGKYYVRPTNKISNCSTGELTELEILDKTQNTVAVDLASFTIPTQCLKPANITGQLQASASGTSTTGYTYTWYAGPSTADPLLGGANVSGPNGEIGQNLVAGFYTIDVLNNTTQCNITDTYELPIDVRPISITSSAEPLTVCFVTPKDGSVFATVTSGNKNDYTYNWYLETVTAVADFTSTPLAPVTDLTIGDYIVVATDNLDGACAVSDTVTVTDDRMIPVAAASPLSPLTICDPARPDGVAAANVGGDVINHSFAWYVDAPPSGIPFYTGSQASDLSAGIYSVIATSIVTGCSDTTQVSVDTQQLPIPNPEIEVLSMVTSCIEDNGALSVSVGGNTSNYVFDWYIGNAEKAIPDFVGEMLDSLAIGFYSVTATSRITGCKSPLVTQEIIEDPIYPLINFTTVAAMCKRDAAEPGTGLAAIFITNGIQIESIEWDVNGMIVTGPILSGVDAGVYPVTVTSVLGCAVTEEIEIKTEIHPFNGISTNNDGQNDIFFINCIESFPTNIVKIFNRAGTLVYEAEGYDNNGTFFDGKSNKGISLMGTTLPGGTYFYIIDKRDGTKPLAGYLEIVN